MAGAGKSAGWGFPRWGGYESSRDAVTVRLCDRHGCNEKGDCPAPKAPNSPERWYFCRTHAAEYNGKWDYFEGLDKAAKEAREREERHQSEGFAEAKHYGWGGAGDGSRSADEMRALELLDLESDADFNAIKKAYRVKAKLVHPDVKPGDAAAAHEFHKLQVAYEVLRQAEERRTWKG